jgi:hypothetical protein
MPQYTFQFRGWHCIVAVALLLCYYGISVYARVRGVDDGMRAAIREYLLNEYSGRSAGDVQRILSEAHSGQAVENLPEVQQHDVEFPSISAVGTYAAEYETVRVEISVDGGRPPLGEALRYFRVEEISSGKWLVVGKSDSYSYYSDLFPFL